MTVSSSTTKVSYSPNGSTHSFAYTFKIFADADLQVVVRSATGTETTQTLNTHYVVTGAASESGGNVLFKYNTGTSSDDHYSTSDYRPANGTTVVIKRNLTLTQGTDYVENDPFASTDHENALDRLTFITQGIQEELDRTLKLSVTNTMTSPEFTTSATDRASKVLSFDASGELAITNELGNYKGTSATTTTAAFIPRDIVKGSTTAQLNNIYMCIADSVAGDTLTDTDHFVLLVDAVSAATSATTASTQATAAASSATAAASSASTASTQASNASTSASTASTQATNAATSATNAATTLTTFQGQYHGAASSDPSSNLDTGDLYFNTSSGIKVYNGSAWEDVKPTSSEQTNINTLAASAVVTDMSMLAVTDVINDMALLADSDVIADMNTLATSDIVSDLNTLATSDIVTDMNLIATSANVTNMATLGASGVVSNIATVAGSISNVNTTASNISGVNSFAERYRVSSSAPSSSLDEGDLYYNTTGNSLNYYNGSSWVAVVAGAMTSLVVDTSPQLGGDLDVNSNSITGLSDLTITGELDCATLDVSGNADIDGTLEADGITLNGVSITAFPWETKTSAFNAEVSKGYFVDTSSAAITATLPASPSAGDTIRFIDLSATFDTNNLTVARNGKKLQGDTSDMTVATERAGFALVFSGDTQGWLLMEK